MPLKGVVLNRVHHEFRPAAPRAARRRRSAPRTSTRSRPSWRGRSAAGPARRAELAANFVDYQALARGESLRIEQFRAGLPRRVPVVTVPNFARDVHDLAALAAMHAHLFGGTRAAA